MGQLTELSKKYNADKYELGYMPHYESNFSSLKDSTIKILEIGIALGDSQKMWLEYFPNATVYGMDSFYSSSHPRHRQVCEQFTTSMQNNPHRDRFISFDGDQENETDLNNFLNQHGNEFDIIIDDGGHTMRQHQISLKVLFKALKPGGLYVIEDLHTCSGQWDMLYGRKTIANRDTITTDLLKSFETPNEQQYSETNYIDETTMSYIKNNIKTCSIETCVHNYKDYIWPTSLAFIQKKL